MSWLVDCRAIAGTACGRAAAAFGRRSVVTTGAVLLTLIAAPAFAHTDGMPGHDHGLLTHPFLSGFAHPFGGLDHLLAMLAVGIWAMQQGGRALFAVPAAFVTGMIAGFVLGQTGFALPLVETGIALSVLAFGLALALALRPPLPLALAATVLFALFHGHAHGAEMPADASALLYATGMLVGTALLHGLGLGLGLGISLGLGLGLGLGISLGRLAARDGGNTKLAGMLPRAAGIIVSLAGGILLLA